MDTPTPAPRPRLPQRLRTALAWLPWLLLLALLADHGWLMLEWARRDSGFALPVFSGAAHPVSETLAQVAAEGWGAVLSSPKPAIFAWLPVALLYLTGPDLDVLTWTNALLMLLSMALIFDAGRLLGGPWAGLVAACALPLLPDVALLEHRWSAGMLQLPLLIGAFDLLIRSRGLSRPLPSLAIAALAWVLLQAADMETENLYALAPLAAMLGAALARGVLTGHGPVGGQRIGRFLPLLFGAMVAGAATWALLRSGHLLPSLAYVQRRRPTIPASPSSSRAFHPRKRIVATTGATVKATARWPASDLRVSSVMPRWRDRISHASPESRSTPRRTRSGAWGHLTDDRRTGCCPSRPTRRSPGRR